MPRYKITTDSNIDTFTKSDSKKSVKKLTSDTDLDEYFGFGEPKKSQNEKYFGDQNIPSIGHYTMPKLRTQAERERHSKINSY